MIDYDLQCEGCRYNLRHQPMEGRCPECGGLVVRSVEFARALRGPFLGWFVWGMRLSVVSDGVAALLLSFTGILYAQLGFRVMFERPWVWVPVCSTVVLMGLQLVGVGAVWMLTVRRAVRTPMGNERSLDDAQVSGMKVSLRGLVVASTVLGSVIGVLAIHLYLTELDGAELRLLVAGLSFLQLAGDGLEVCAVLVGMRYLVRMAKDLRVEWLIVPTVVILLVGLGVSLVGAAATMDNFSYAMGGGPVMRRRTFYLLYWINRVGEVGVCGAGVFLWMRWKLAVEGLRAGVGEVREEEGGGSREEREETEEREEHGGPPG